MGRKASHNWQKLFLEYNQGRYKNVAEFAKAKDIYPDRMRKEFRKLANETESKQVKKSPNNESKQVKKNDSKNDASQKQVKTVHPWETLKKQFLDWPDEKLQTYLTQLEARKAELESIPFEDLAKDEIKELGQVRRERRAILSDPDPERKCHAHNHDGSPCGNPVERGKKTCWNHGGAPGSGAKPGDQRALKHGLYAKLLPNDPEFLEFMEQVRERSPLDILWDDIVLLQSQIAWSQRIMFVKHKEEMIKELKKVKSERGPNYRYNPDDPDSEPLAETYREEEWEFQFSWDRQATTLTAQSKAMKTLEGMIRQYEAMANEEQKLMVEKLKQDIDIARERLQLDKAKVNGNEDEVQDDGFIDALKSDAVNIWAGDRDDGND
jgi:uncharacterized protein YjcR